MSSSRTQAVSPTRLIRPQVSDLSDEIILEIMQHLVPPGSSRRLGTFSSDLRRAALTCKKWDRAVWSIKHKWDPGRLLVARKDFHLELLPQPDDVPHCYKYSLEVPAVTEGVHRQIPLPTLSFDFESEYNLVEAGAYRISQLEYVEEEFGAQDVKMSPWEILFRQELCPVSDLLEVTIIGDKDIWCSSEDFWDLRTTKLPRLERLSIICVQVDKRFQPLNPILLYPDFMPRLESLQLMDLPVSWKNPELRWGIDGIVSDAQDDNHSYLQQQMLSEVEYLELHLRHLALTNWQASYDMRHFGYLLDCQLTWTWTTPGRWRSHILVWMADFFNSLGSCRLYHLILEDYTADNPPSQPTQLTMWLPFLVGALSHYECFLNLHYLRFWHPRRRIEGTEQAQPLAEACARKGIKVIENDVPWPFNNESTVV